MCLIVNKDYVAPEDDSIRYKLVHVTEYNTYIAPLQATSYFKEGWNIAENYDGIDLNRKGYHVFLYKEDGYRFKRNFCLPPCVKLFKCQCRGFIAGGQHDTLVSTDNEIWKEIKFLEEVPEKTVKQMIEEIVKTVEPTATITVNKK